MFEAPYPPYDPTDTSSFSYETVLKRWPTILTGVVNEVYLVNHDLTLESRQKEEKTEKEPLLAQLGEGKKLIERIGYLKYRMARDMEMLPIEEDGGAAVVTYNDELERLGANGKNTWFKAPWLFAECYLYRLIRSYFALTVHWHEFDPFLTQKMDAFRGSGDAIYSIATSMHELDKGRHLYEDDEEQLGLLFEEMVQMCLWGNATDLSLLTHLSSADVARLQSVGKEAHATRKRFILRDDQKAAWEHVKGMRAGRVDCVLDNAGFEVCYSWKIECAHIEKYIKLFTDLVFADFLVTYTPYVSKVVFHPKLIPWFVSDVTPSDFSMAIASLLEPTFFHSSSPSSPASNHLSTLAARLQSHIADGTFALSVPSNAAIGSLHKMADFWTEPWPYWDMKPRDPALWRTLHESGLVIFKGDLNYRKLTGDVKWPASTPFRTALAPLVDSFPILSLRTNKADVAVGIDQETADRLDQSGEKWRVNGRYALISFSSAEPAVQDVPVA